MSNNCHLDKMIILLVIDKKNASHSISRYLIGIRSTKIGTHSHTQSCGRAMFVLQAIASRFFCVKIDWLQHNRRTNLNTRTRDRSIHSNLTTAVELEIKSTRLQVVCYLCFDKYSFYL